MITLSNKTKGLALLHQVVNIYDSLYKRFLLEKVLYWQQNGSILNFGMYYINSMNVEFTS